MSYILNLNKLNDILKNTKKYNKKCVGFCIVEGEVLLAFSGDQLDYYDKSYKINNFSLDKSFDNFKQNVRNLINPAAKIISLNSLCCVMNKKKSYNMVEYIKRISPNVLGLFSCVERKLIFCSNTYIKKSHIYVSKEPCDKCRPYLNKRTITYISKKNKVCRKFFK